MINKEKKGKFISYGVWPGDSHTTIARKCVRCPRKAETNERLGGFDCLSEHCTIKYNNFIQSACKNNSGLQNNTCTQSIQMCCS